MSKGTLSCKHESAFYFLWKEKSRAFCSAHDNAEDGVRRIKKKVRGTFFPPNRPTKALAPRRSEPLGSGAPRRKIKGLSLYGLTLLFSCGRWDLNPHGVTTTRSLVLLVCQFRHFRLAHRAKSIIALSGANVNTLFMIFHISGARYSTRLRFLTKTSYSFMKFSCSRVRKCMFSWLAASSKSLARSESSSAPMVLLLDLMLWMSTR